MIVVDTSAFVAVLKNEPDGPACMAVIEASSPILMSAATAVEAMIVATRQGFATQMAGMIRSTVSQIVPVTPERVEHIVATYARWGKGIHPAALNFGACFAYATAIEHACPLLYIGTDFAKTDVRSARLSA